MRTGWMRFNSSEVFGCTLSLSCRFPSRTTKLNWLSQANHIFNCLRINSNFEDYVLVESVEFLLTVWKPIKKLPPAFLFVRPIRDFQHGCSFSWPLNYPAYWSFNPTGIEPMSWRDAAQLGFPYIQLTTVVKGSSWDANVYAGLRQFHKSNGFDPDSQDVANHLGREIFQFSNEIDPLFAHGKSPTFSQTPTFD
ncbi:hypothetical protein B0H19DRAFT_1077970 [Mycena capillaripes]|nr:hypothetical protein B0H19DRAFT_1077970 [Mycena capillaripes]